MMHYWSPFCHAKLGGKVEALPIKDSLNIADGTLLPVHLFLHHIFLDYYPLGFFIHTRLMVIFLCTFSFSIPLIFLTLLFFYYTLFIMLWLGCGLITSLPFLKVIIALTFLTFEDSPY